MHLMDNRLINEYMFCLAMEEDDEELLAFFCYENARILKKPNEYVSFHMLEQQMDGPSVQRRFRFKLDGLRILHSVLRLPEVIKCRV